MLRPTVLLFDIDGTLVSSGGAGRRAMERAFAELYGSAAPLRFTFAGMTDRGIVRTGLDASDATITEAAIDAVIERYLALLPAEVQGASDYATLPGVTDLLCALTDWRHIAVGLGTGNVERGARIKLAPVQLNDHFAFGGFGCDHEARERLIAAGITRGAARLHKEPGDCRVVVVGDTPRDVQAALANSAECIGVATGRYSVSELAAAGATVACENLCATAAWTALLS